MIKSGVKLCDFASAVKGKNKHSSPVTKNDLCITPMYAAPEVISLFHKTGTKDTENGMAADSWSIGCTIAEMITHEPIFSEDDIFNPYTLKQTKDIPYAEIIDKYLTKHATVLREDNCNILRQMLDVNPKTRLSVQEASQKFPSDYTQ